MSNPVVIHHLPRTHFWIYGILLWFGLSAASHPALAEPPAPPEISFQVIGSEPPAELYKTCRRMVVGPTVNPPDDYPGYGGFVGWPGVTRLRSGRWLLTFSSGYWHASPPLTEEIKNDPQYRPQLQEWQKLGMPDLLAPRGGRIHWIWSDDQGRTWSRPQTLIDTELDDRHATILELDNGSLLCTFFQYRLPGFAQARYVLSSDGGRSWSNPQGLPTASVIPSIPPCTATATPCSCRTARFTWFISTPAAIPLPMPAPKPSGRFALASTTPPTASGFCRPCLINKWKTISTFGGSVKTGYFRSLPAGGRTGEEAVSG